MASRFSAVLVVGLPLLYSACGSDNLTLPGEGEPAHVTIMSGNGQSQPVSSALAPLVVKVTDTQGRAISGVTVEFTFDDAASDASVAPPSAKTDPSGQTSTTITLPSHVGAVNGRARVSDSPAATPVEAAFTATALPDNASVVQAFAGDGQSGPVGSALSQPLVALVTDQFNNPIAGVTITWTVEGGGSVSESSTQTGPDGKTSVTRTLGTVAGQQSAKATAEALAGSPSVTFSHEATAGSASRIEKFAGDGQSAQAGAELSAPLVVRVLDGQGNPVVGRAVTWVVGAGGGSVTPQNTTTDAQGKASTRWTLGSSVGTNTVNAVVSGVGTATFSATATAGSVSASQSRVTVSDGSITAGSETSTITVRVRDANGTGVSGVSVSVSSSGSGNQIDPGSATSDDNGVATFTFSSTVGGEDKTITAVAGGVTLDQHPTISVKKADSRTRITGHDPNPSTSGQSVHVTVTVSSSQGGGTPTGNVRIVSDKEPSSVSCTATLDASGQGSCDITLTAVGNHRLIALYDGDSRFDVSNDDDSHQVLPAPNPPPTAAFTHADCTAGTECQFNDASSDNGLVVAWHWDFGDVASPNNVSELQNPTHSFTLGGGTQYTVTLTVTDNQGTPSSTSQTFMVQ
jgi:Big-like domain-containing protein/PKD domain-containing protein